MAQKVLDYASHDGGELFETDNDYNSGEPRWAARGDWFIRFWGYVFTPVDPANVPDPLSTRAILFRDSTDGDKFKVKTSSGTVALIDPDTIGLAGVDAKAVPVGADAVIVIDSADGDALKQTTLAQLKAFLTPEVTHIINTDSPFSAAFESVVLANPVSGNIIVTLPDPSVITGGRITVKRLDAGNTLTVARNSTESIEGSASDYDIPTNLLAVTFISDGTDWWVLSTS